MEIDWLTVGAQIVNFLVLVWLLQRFLYRPIIQAMDRREQRIADRLKDAARKSEEAADQAEANRAERQKLEAERDRMLEKARDEAEALRKSLSEDIRNDFEKKRKEWSASLENERDDFLREVRRQTGNHVVAVARRALKDMASADLERQIAEVFLDLFHNLKDATKRQLKDAVDRGDRRVIVRSAFDLSADLRRRLTRAIHEEIGKDADVAYETSDDMSCGIALRTGSQVVEWSLAGYLDTLEERLSETLRRGATTEDRGTEDRRKAG